AGMAAAMRAFANAPGSTFFYSGAVHKQLLEGLVRALRDRLGLHLVLGDFGTGKTTLCNFVLMAYSHEFIMGYLGNPFVDETEFFRQVAAVLGAEAPETASAKECLDALEGFLRRQHMERKVCVVFVDEAHLLDPALLDRLLVLSNLQVSGVPLLQVVLAGVPGLLDLLAMPRFGSLNQRIGSRHWLQPLGKAELNEYVRHRLAHAGSDQELFSPRALSAVQRRSGGRPRLVNMLCRLSLEVC
ncbi:AAA family ATPase, partial [Desulfocurvibacter africanus]|uniref:ExeA family protein n=1 Tax=Desulfocurvibacter africanus TaxID=873 RepID=UPI002FD9206D